MKSLIDRFNNENPQPQNLKPVVREIEDDRFSFYENKMNEKKSFEVCFDYADAEGNLSVIDEKGINLSMTAEEFTKNNPYYKAKIKDKFLGTYLQVKVKSIDHENGIVNLTSVIGADNIRGGVIKELMRAINKGEKVSVWGTVALVSSGRVTVNIFNRNVLGIISASDWSHVYPRNLDKRVRRGEVVNCIVIGQAKKLKGKDYAFNLSRKELYPNPWESDSIKKIEKNGIINVSVVERPLDKSYAWGVSPYAPEIEIMVNFSRNLNIMEGLTYKCKVVDIRPEDSVFKVTPFELVESNPRIRKNIADLKKKNNATQ